ncbi:MAG: hypothetical protein KAR20_04700 [Candidatus Heimdallarchaeota archaeon]|nr:hypothetical protein [Candidatus Heimdallarchaeota archaeon]
MRLYVGQKVRVKVYDERPFRWNGGGRMDVFMGKIVTIRSTSPRITIEEDNRKNTWKSTADKDYWAWDHQDFEPIVEIVQLPEDLFKI